MNIIQLVQEQESLFNGAMSDYKMDFGKEAQFAIQAFQANDFLAKTALSNPASAQNAIINISAIGISLNPAMKHAYLVPRSVKKGNQYVQSVCLDISYMGMMHLAQESGSIKWGQAVIVRQNDHFALNGLGERPTHSYSPFGERGEIVGVYCCVKTADGDYLTECMSIADVWDIRARSESFKKGFGPWVSDTEEMIKKTVVKRAYKYWPKVKRLAAAIEYQNANGEGVTLDHEPIVPHTSAAQEKEAADKRKAALVAIVQEWIDKMESSKSLEELKGAFANAFRLSKEFQDVNQQVQAIYAKNKGRFAE